MADSKRFRWIRWLLRAVATITFLAIALLVLTPTGRYLLRGAWAEGRILARRRPIGELIADSATPASLRAKLELVLAARAFARDSLGLKTRESFTTYSETGHDTLTLALSGAYRDKLRPYTWWFPVVGRVPYKGYFDFAEARREERALNARGFDTRLGAVSAFSTLGWFNDPLLPATLRADSLTLVNTVIHELTHNTYYAPGRAVFNESFANFVGSRGAQRFYRSRGQITAADELGARWEDEKLLGRFWASLYARVDSAFDAHPGDGATSVATRIAVRDSLFRESRQQFVHEVGPRLKTISVRAVERVRLDNAILMSRRIYLTDLDMFDAVLARHGGDVRETLALIISAAKAERGKPFEAVRRLAGLPAGSPPRAARRELVSVRAPEPSPHQ